jgi:hypothetical protein
MRNNGQSGRINRKIEVITFQPEEMAAKDLSPKVLGSSSFT